MIITCTKDLIFKSKLKGIVTKSEHHFAKDLSSLNEKLSSNKYDLLIIDLAQASPQMYAKLTELKDTQPDLEVLAFAAHVDRENIELATKIGVKVMYRSQFVKEIDQILEQF